MRYGRQTFAYRGINRLGYALGEKIAPKRAFANMDVLQFTALNYHTALCNFLKFSTEKGQKWLKSLSMYRKRCLKPHKR